MPSELRNILLNAVSPFDQGVSALKLNVLRSPNQDLSRPNRTAAILVPIIDKPELEILLTVRSNLLLQHPGQVSFPGGAVDRKDSSAVSTALREAEEEIGLHISQVSPIGFLDRLDTISDYRVLRLSDWYDLHLSGSLMNVKFLKFSHCRLNWRSTGMNILTKKCSTTAKRL